MSKPTTLRERFNMLDGKRSEILDKSYLHANFTIPRLFPERYFQGDTHTWSLPELYSNKAGNNVMTLASMMTTALFPPNDVPFYELKLSPELTQEERDVLLNPVQEVERLALDVLQASNLRPTIFVALQHAIVMGDSLIHQLDSKTFKVYHPAHFLIRRDGSGDIVEYWTLDWVVTDLLEDDLSKINGGKPTDSNGEHEPLYTQIRKDGDKWNVEREFRNVKYETDKSYKILPYYHLGWTPVAGEDYSRSLVEENFGTIRSLELVSKALAEGVSAGSEGRILLDPTSTTTEDDIIGSTNWSIISARPGSIEAFQPNVSGTVSVAATAMGMYEEALDKAFLATSVAQLRGERVTAFQTNQVLNEQAQALGGTLSTLEQDIERIVNRTIFLLVEDKKLSKEFRTLMDEKAVTISISSGLDALGRQADVLRLENILNLALQSQQPEMIEVLKFPAIMRALARNSGLDMDMYTRTEEEVAERQQAQQQQQVQQQAAQQAISSVGNIAESNLG